MINYENLYKSIEYYTTHGKFSRIETPWMVTEDISAITRPVGADDFRIYRKTRNDKVLVASGEQSFLYLYNKGFLPKGRFQTITPCFRQETITKTHGKYFIKNELIDTENVNENSLQDIIHTAKKFFESIIHDTVSVTNETLGIYDIEYQGIELGSYGIRSCEFLEWIFATGCAEPRLSFCQNLNKS